MRPRRTEEQRRELLPIVARAFADLGYRRATTLELARRCRVQETILYRLWPDKKAMFIAAIRHVYELAAKVWTREGAREEGGFSSVRALAYEARHLGEFGHYRIIFAGLGETDDAEIRGALAAMYRDFHAFLESRVGTVGPRRGCRHKARRIAPDLAAWALIGLGTVSTIVRELGVLDARGRERLFKEVGALLFGMQRD